MRDHRTGVTEKRRVEMGCVLNAASSLPPKELNNPPPKLARMKEGGIVKNDDPKKEDLGMGLLKKHTILTQSDYGLWDSDQRVTKEPLENTVTEEPNHAKQRPSKLKNLFRKDREKSVLKWAENEANIIAKRHRADVSNEKGKKSVKAMANFDVQRSRLMFHSFFYQKLILTKGQR